jgi:uncharacterized protein YecT (DUF1311 family)
MVKKSYLLIALLAVSPISFGASFDCAKATTETEKLICSDLRASELDTLMGESYKRTLSWAVDKDDVLNTQRLWLKQRDQCKDLACVKSQYESRLAQLHSVPYKQKKWKMLTGDGLGLCESLIDALRGDPNMSTKLRSSPSPLSKISGVSFISWNEMPEEEALTILVPSHKTNNEYMKKLEGWKYVYPEKKFYIAKISYSDLEGDEYLIKSEYNDQEKDMGGGAFYVFSNKFEWLEGAPETIYGRPFFFKNLVYILRSDSSNSVGIYKVFSEDKKVRIQTYCNMEIEE